MGSAIKLQINNLEALERLIGGNTEIEIELRNSIAYEFSKKYLKSCVDEKIQSLVPSYIKEFFYKKDWNGNVTINKEVQDKLTEVIKNKISVTLDEKIDELIQPYYEELNKIIKEKAEFLAAQVTDQSLEKRINFLADKKIKEKLGI